MDEEIRLVGYLGGDPEMRYTTQGKAVTNFSMATSQRWTGADGERQEKTTWWRVSAWGRLAETCNEYLAKGRQVLVKCRMNPDERGNPRVFQRKDGSWGASYEVTANRVLFLSGGGDRERSKPAFEEAPPGYVEEDEVPF